MKDGWVTVLVVLALAALAALCLVSFLRRLSGKKSCCEGAAKRVPAKKLTRVSGTFIIRISGMHCARCQENVTRGDQRGSGARGQSRFSAARSRRQLSGRAGR